MIACWEKADHLALLCVMFSYVFVIFSYDILGWVWYRGLPVGFLLLRYSVLFTVESLSLLFISLLYLDLYVLLGDDALIS